jgi:hypothetical protein
MAMPDAREPAESTGEPIGTPEIEPGDIFYVFSPEPSINSLFLAKSNDAIRGQRGYVSGVLQCSHHQGWDRETVLLNPSDQVVRLTATEVQTHESHEGWRGQPKTASECK